MNEVLGHESIYNHRLPTFWAKKMVDFTGTVVSQVLRSDSNHDGENIIFYDERGSKMAIIEYSLIEQWEDTICYISFFWTQNGIWDDYSMLHFLDSATINRKWISYEIMLEFIHKYCLPNNVKRIYLDADMGSIYPGASISKKDFWKLKMWEFMKRTWFIERVYSQWSEICFVLKT